MILILEILVVLFFFVNLAKLMYDYLDEIKEINYINMILVVASIAVLILLNYIGMKLQ